MKSKDVGTLQEHVKHKAQKSGKKIKNQKEKNIEKNHTRGTNLKAFSIQNVKNARYNITKQASIEYGTAKLPVNVRQGEIPAPDMVAIFGSPGVGKTTLLKALVKSYSGKSVTTPVGPITVSVSTTKRLTLFDVPSELTAVIDIARVTELAIIVIDASKPLETDIFEYLNVFQALGFPKVFTVLTHEDQITSKYFKVRKQLKQRIEREIANGCKIFDMPFLENRETYKKEKVDVLARCISQQKYQMPLEWRSTHGCVLVDRVEPHNNGTLSCFGFVRGTYITQSQLYTIPGYKDVELTLMEVQKDPALPNDKLVLNKNKPVLYAPLSEIGDIKVDNEAIRVRVNENEKRGRAAQAQDIIQNIKIREGGDVHLFDDDDEVVKVDQGIKEQKNDEKQDNETNENQKDDEIESELLDDYEQGEEEDEEQEEDENKWLDSEDEPENGDCKSESTDEKLDLDEEELLKHAQQNEEEEEEPENEIEMVEQKKEVDNIESYLRKLKLIKPDASKQYYHDLIYNYYKQPKNIQQVKKSSLLQLFDDDNQSKDQINVSALPLKMRKNYAQLPFELRDSSRVYPINSLFINKELKFTVDFSASAMSKYFIPNTDFAAAVHRCLDGEHIEETKDKVEEQSIQKENPNKDEKESKSNPLLEVKIDGKFLQDKESELTRTKEREKLLDSHLSQTRFAPGQYVKFEFRAEKEFINNYKRCNPLILGGLLPQENQQQYITAKVKKHRWFPRILKSRNPLVFAIGWRRFQSLPYYSMQQEGKTAQAFDTAIQTESPPQKLLKYTPEHMHCWATFYGYRVPSGSGVIAFQDVSSKGFRVCLNGIVQESSFDVKLYKKLKLVGVCDELFNKTAFINKMFTNKLEASAFVGAAVRTVSGIRGIIKRANNDKGQIRASFEDKIRPNDVVFMKTYVKCRVDKFYNEWDNHLGEFQQIRQMAEIRAERGIPITYNADSVYKFEKRPVFVQPELNLRKDIVKNLPFESAKQYANEKLQRDKVDDFEWRKRQIKDKDLRSLVDGGKQEERGKLLSEFKALNEQLINEREEKMKKEQYAKDKWTEGMNRKHDEAKAEQKAEQMKKRRFAIQKAQKAGLKRGKL